MDNAIAFEDRSTRFGLPFLFPGQAQREFYVNESLARLDMLLHPAIERTMAEPPADPAPGQTFLVAAPATGAWRGKENQLTCWDGQQWTFSPPVAGMRAFDKSTDRFLLWRDGWIAAAAVAEPTGGDTVDHQSRAALGQLIGSLRDAGIL